LSSFPVSSYRTASAEVLFFFPRIIEMILLNDVKGAQAVGIRAIWMNRHQLPNKTNVQPFAEITSLAELPEVLT
jgi:hypothetical protein